jgi:uncharacterized membrane protein YphA (DoxX/SURF4 family)
MVAAAIPSEVRWSYLSFWVIFIVGLAAIFLRGDWQKARGLDKLILFGPIFYAAPLAAFGTEHFTLTTIIASLIPKWIPWHYFWAYLLGACFIAAALSLVTGIQARLAASLVAFTMFMFVALMYFPSWLRRLDNRIVLTIALRETSFSGGALALAASLSERWDKRGAHVMAIVARYLIAIPVLFFSVQQFLHGDHVPGVPLERLTPTYLVGHAIWTYLAAAIYAVAGIMLLIGKRTRMAATWLGLTVLFVELVVYVPIAIIDRASLQNGLNYMADTLMFCGAILLLARAMPREAQQEPATRELEAGSRSGAR